MGAFALLACTKLERQRQASQGHAHSPSSLPLHPSPLIPSCIHLLVCTPRHGHSRLLFPAASLWPLSCLACSLCLSLSYLDPLLSPPRMPVPHRPSGNASHVPACLLDPSVSASWGSRPPAFSHARASRRVATQPVYAINPPSCLPTGCSIACRHCYAPVPSLRPLQIFPDDAPPRFAPAYLSPLFPFCLCQAPQILSPSPADLPSFQQPPPPFTCVPGVAASLTSSRADPRARMQPPCTLNRARQAVGMRGQPGLPLCNELLCRVALVLHAQLSLLRAPSAAWHGARSTAALPVAGLLLGPPLIKHTEVEVRLPGEHGRSALG